MFSSQLFLIFALHNLKLQINPFNTIMKKGLLLAFYISLVIGAVAQTQSGFVKTRGRLVNGKVIAGQRIAGATVQVKGRTAVVTQSNGVFSFPVPASRFSIQNVKKHGYLLSDPEALSKQYTYSPNPIIIVMDNREQQTEDKLIAERKLRRTLQRQLQQREEEIDALKAQNSIDKKEHQSQLERLYAEQENNEKLIKEMAERYSRIDYDQLDDFNRNISECILEGRLTTADSLLRSKGSISERITMLNKHHETNEQMQEAIDKSKAMEQRDREDIAQDCYHYYEKFLMEQQFDSAAVYITQRALLDPTNIQWQLDAGSYFQKRRQPSIAESYYQRALDFSRKQVQDNNDKQDLKLALALNNLSLLYQEMGRTIDAKQMLNEALDIYKYLAVETPQVYNLYVASTLNNLAQLSSNFTSSDSLYSESLEIYLNLAQEDAKSYAPQVASIMSNLGLLYDENEYPEQSDEMYRKALDIYRKLAERQPSVYNDNVAATLNNWAALYTRYNINEQQVEQMHQEALDIYRQLSQEDPTLYQPILAAMLYSYAITLYRKDQIDKSEPLFTESLNIYRQLSNNNTNTYKAETAKLLRNLANLLDKRQCWNSSEQMFLEELEINKKLASDQPTRFTADVARTYGNLSNHAILMGDFDKAAQYAKEGLSCDSTKLFIHANLAAALLFGGQYDQAAIIYQQYRSELHDIFLDDFEQFGKLGVIPKEREKDVERIRQLLLQ